MSTRRLYETTYIINAALEDAEIQEAVARISEYIVQHGGTILEINRWGRRRMAYPIKKKYNGYYVHCIFDAPPSSIPVIERYLNLDDSVLRHLTIQLSERLIELRKQRTGTAIQPPTEAPVDNAVVPDEIPTSEQPS